VTPLRGVSVQRYIFGTLLVALNRHDANTPTQDRGQLGVAELVEGAVIVDRRVQRVLERLDPFVDGGASEASRAAA
jgi:hypothetical protein